MRPFRTNAGAPVIASSRRCTLGRTRCGAGRRRVRDVVCDRTRKVEEVGSFGVVQLQRAGERLEHQLGDAAQIAALEARVVVDADAGQKRDLFPAEPRHSPRPAVRAQPRLLRRDLPAPGGQEFPRLAPRVHDVETNAAPRTVRGPADTWFNRAGLAPSIGASVSQCWGTREETRCKSARLETAILKSRRSGSAAWG